MQSANAFLGTIVLGALLVGCGGRYATSEDLLSLPTRPPSPVDADSLLASQGEASDPVDLEGAIALVLGHNPELRAAAEQVLATDAGRVQTHAWDNPELLVDLEGIGGDRRGFRQTEVTVALGMPVDVFGKRGTRIRVAEAEVEATRARFVETRRQLVAQTRLAFHKVLAAQELLRISMDRFRATEETAVATARQVDAGKVPPLHQIRAEVAREAARSRVESARALVQAARLELASLWGAADASVKGSLRSTTPQIDRSSLADLLLASNPRLLEALWIAERQRRHRDRISRERMPDVTPALGVRWLTESGHQDFVAGVAIGLPILDRKAAAMTAAERTHAASLAKVEAIRRELLAELTLVLQRLDEATTRFQAYVSEIVPRAQEALDLARTGYEGGKFGYLELLDAQNTFIDVESGRADALIALDQALTRLEGLFDHAMDETMPLDSPNKRKTP